MSSPNMPKLKEICSYFEENKRDVFSVKSSVAKANALLKTEVTYLKPKQFSAIVSAIRDDVLVLLPTGYGKTIIFQILPFCEDNACIIVISPLNSILCEQQARFGRLGVLIQEKSDMKDITRNTRYIIGHPEVLTSDHVKTSLKEISKRISHIVVDEVHCVLSWGKSMFRPAYLKIASLRAILTKAKVLALTATANLESQKEIVRELLMEQAQVIAHTPDRPNVFLEAKKRSPTTGGHYTPEDSINGVVDSYLSDLREQGRWFPKTILYAKLEVCGYIHNRAISHFLTDHPEENTVQDLDAEELDCLIQQYHAPQTNTMKALITKSMKNPYGKLRLLLATQAYGMGADAPDVRRVVHVGPPYHIESYMQELGRCGRDGMRATATLFYNAMDISANASHLQNSMREYCKLTTCRREYILKYFNFSKPQITDHDCCDNCCVQCKCSTCLTAVSAEVTSSMLAEMCTDMTNEPSEVKPNKATKYQTEEVFNLLLQYFNHENSLVANTQLPQVTTGLSEVLAKSISTNVKRYPNASSLQEDYPLLETSFVNNIHHIISSVVN